VKYLRTATVGCHQHAPDRPYCIPDQPLAIMPLCWQRLHSPSAIQVAAANHGSLPRCTLLHCFHQPAAGPAESPCRFTHNSQWMPGRPVGGIDRALMLQAVVRAQPAAAAASRSGAAWTAYTCPATPPRPPATPAEAASTAARASGCMRSDDSSSLLSASCTLSNGVRSTWPCESVT